jgi:hypothetical protein
MKSLTAYAVAFFVGVIFTLIAMQGSFRDLRFAFSPALEFANGSHYVGGLNAQGQLEGQGRLEWSSGDKYDGEFLAGLFHGKGKFTSQYSGDYKGDFAHGYMEGKGTLVYPDDTRYQGEFSGGRFHGKGTLMSANGAVYEGDFVSNKMSGTGKWQFPDKSIYIGQVKNGVIEGKGELRRIDGAQYTGEFVAGKMQGQGVFVDSQGNRYSGEFKEDSFTGTGSFTSSEGFTYVGEFERWRLNGKAVQTDKEGNQWEGNYLNGQLHGAGSFVGKDGVQYRGEFRFGQYDGEGKLISAEGDIYEGEFSYGNKHGRGVLIYKKPIDGISRVEGRWHMERLVDGGKDLKIYTPEEIAEYALYQSSYDLQLALSAVQESDPDKIELYSLVIAGFGTEEVFHRESKMIENLFSAQYGNRATAVYLANSQRSLDERPMATLTSISAAIARIAERMDKENDIFFLYITSHGSKDEKISLHHNGLQFADIDSQWLARQLKASGIKHQVVVLSACYSGGFIDDLKDGHSLIMTAAAADKTSFGCADDSLSTYFGRAYFQESLKPGVDFEQAFYHAKALVEAWEKERKFPASEPQIVPNAKVLKQVRLWLQGLDISLSVDLKP